LPDETRLKRKPWLKSWARKPVQLIWMTKRLFSALNDVQMVLNCFSGSFRGYHLNLPEAAVESGVHYLDVCGAADYSEQALKLDERAKKAGVIMITALGANPGMSSVIMMSNRKYFDVIENGEILFAMGADIKGISAAGLKELRYMFKVPPLEWNGRWEKPRKNSKTLFIGPPFNKKIFFGAALTCDILCLPELLHINHLRSWSGLQSLIQGMFLYIGCSLGMTNTDARAERFLRRIKRLGKFKGATGDLVIRVTAEGTKDGKPVKRVIEICAEENYATAVSPAIAILQMVEGKINAPGAYLPPQIVQAEEFVGSLEKFGVKCKIE